MILQKCEISEIKSDETSEVQLVSQRKKWPLEVSRSILTKCHFRCGVCPEHRRIADIHHIDGDNSNSVEMNGIALCKLCHTDAHTTSSMQRNLKSDHLREFKMKWEETCEKLARSLTYGDSSITNVYYMNVHRLDALLRELGEKSVLTSIPHKLPDTQGSYNTLWANPANPLNWQQLLENRNYFESRLNDGLDKLSTIELALLEVGAVDANAHVGGLVNFDCKFIGQDIPDQNELVQSCGQIVGPVPTMRREINDVASESDLRDLHDARYALHVFRLLFHPVF